MDKMVFIKTKAECYSPEYCTESITVGELIEKLQEYDENLKICFDNDNGYTYGSIDFEDIYEKGI